MDTPPSTPKRKRPGIITTFQTNFSPATPSPQKFVDTRASEQERCASNSPRTLVANRLGMLDVRGQSIDRTFEAHDNDSDGDTPMEVDGEELSLRKKSRAREEGPERTKTREWTEGGLGNVEIKGAASPAIALSNPEAKPRSGKSRATGSPEAENGHEVPLALPAKAHPQRPIKQPRPKIGKRPKSPPPPTGIAPVSPAAVYTANTTSATLESTDSTDCYINESRGVVDWSQWARPGELTWHESEITGHLGLDPDDDGTGINGIGFRPTAQQTHARAQKRKQQIREWRAREGREARDRRREARFASGTMRVQTSRGGEGNNEREGHRMVRFAGGNDHGTDE